MAGMTNDEQEPLLSVAQLPSASQPAVQCARIGRSSSRSLTPVQTPKDDAKGRSGKNQTHTAVKRNIRDAYYEDIHVMELKEAAERRTQKNAIRMKELELQEKKHAAKVKKMEMDAEIQKAQLNMLKQHGKAESGSSTPLDGSMTMESWVHSQQASMSSGDSSPSGQMGVFSGSVERSPDAEFIFSANDLHFPDAM
ncbi:hypothetical protein BGY98DRAFT_1103840 [Russula aff. rugulosa BPL654]|nr:hypothetical protein BGY98DRAFT_1103840 [Russula aff. rugulosa BPL654]